MWLCVFPCRQYEDTFEKAQRRKAFQMQPMWLCIFTDRSFEETFENAWCCMMLESNKSNMTAFLGTNILRKHLKEENWNYAHGLVKLNFICLNKCIFKYGSISCHHCQLEVSPWHFQILTQLHLSSLREFSLMLFTSIWPFSSMHSMFKLKKWKVHHHQHPKKTTGDRWSEGVSA